MASCSLLAGMTGPCLGVHSLPVCGARSRSLWSSDKVEQETLNPFPPGSEVPSTAQEERQSKKKKKRKVVPRSVRCGTS